MSQLCEAVRLLKGGGCCGRLQVAQKQIGERKNKQKQTERACGEKGSECAALILACLAGVRLLLPPSGAATVLGVLAREAVEASSAAWAQVGNVAVKECPCVLCVHPC